MDRTVGNTGGLGGVFALFYGVGAPLPFPEARPFSPSWPYALFQKFGALAARFRGSA
jgi:hypothetical protein